MDTIAFTHWLVDVAIPHCGVVCTVTLLRHHHNAPVPRYLQVCAPPGCKRVLTLPLVAVPKHYYSPSITATFKQFYFQRIPSCPVTVWTQLIVFCTFATPCRQPGLQPPPMCCRCLPLTVGRGGGPFKLTLYCQFCTLIILFWIDSFTHLYLITWFCYSGS